MKDDIIRELRTALSPLPEGVTDEEVLEKSRGTILRFSCEFRDLIRKILRAFGVKPKF